MTGIYVPVGIAQSQDSDIQGNVNRPMPSLE